MWNINIEKEGYSVLINKDGNKYEGDGKKINLTDMGE